MKKIFILLSVFIISILFYSTSLAVTTPSEGTIVATVSINNAKIISNNGRDYKISFDISNRVGAQPQVKYSVRLMQNDTLVDEKVYEETLSLGDNTTISKTIDYTIPSSIPLGTYSIWIDSKNENGLMLGVAIAGDVKITEAVPNTIEIIPGSCYLGQSLLSQGVVISSTDTFTAKCKVTSSLSSNITLIPSFITRSHTSFGDIVPTTGSSTGNVIIKNGSNDITLILPKASKPQDYNLTFNLASADKKTISNSISFNYILSGQSGTIQNVVFDKTSYKAGETANLQIFSTQTGTSTITAVVLNSDGYCSATSTKDISNFSVVNLLIPITKDCNNPKANVILSAGSNILDSRNFQIATPISTTTSATSMSANKIIIASILIFLAFIFIVLIYKKRHSGIRMVMIGILVSVGVFGLSNTSFANVCTVYWDGGSSTGFGVQYGHGGVYIVHNMHAPYQDTKCAMGNNGLCHADFGSSFARVSMYDLSGNKVCQPDDSYRPTYPPTGLTASCPAPGTTATISWDLVMDISHMVRVDNTTNGWNGGCDGGQMPGDVCFTKAGIDRVAQVMPPITKESYTFSSVPGVTYTWWVHAGASDPASGPAFTCTPAACTSWTYSAWGVCSPSTRTQTRSVTSSAPSGCTGGSPVTAQSCTPVPTATLSASPSTVSSSQYATLSGTVTDVSSCTLAGGPLGTRAWSSNGAYSYNSGSLTSNTPFVLSCSGPGGSVTKNVTVSVVPLIPININLNASPLTVQVGSSSMISWNVTGADSCTMVKNGSLWNTVSASTPTRGAGSGNGQFDNPYAVVLDSAGNIYVADANNNRVQKFNSSGTYLFQFGSEGSGNGQFIYPRGIAIDPSGNIYVADYGNNRVQKFNSSGTYLSQFSPRYGVNTGSPFGITVDSSGNTYVSVDGYRMIQKFNPSGAIVLTIADVSYGGSVNLTRPFGVALDSAGNIYVTDNQSYNVKKFSPAGTFISQFGSAGSGNGQFNRPWGITIDSAGNIYVVDAGDGPTYPSTMNNYRVQKFNSSGTFLSKFGSYGTGNGQFSYPVGITRDPSNNVYVVDAGDNRVEKFNSSGTFLSQIESVVTPPISGSKTSGPITSATTFTAQCINAGNSATKSVIVDITALPQPQLTLNADETQIVWEATEADSCTLKQDGTVVSTDMSGSIPADNLAQGIEFILKCIGPGGTTSTSTKSVAPAIRSTCTPTQAGNAPGDNNIYVNRNTTWTANLSASGTTITSRTWSGTNIPSTTGLTLNKIYTTVGLKYINATTTGKRSDNSSFTSHCYATTTVKLDTGTGGEI